MIKLFAAQNSINRSPAELRFPRPCLPKIPRASLSPSCALKSTIKITHPHLPLCLLPVTIYHKNLEYPDLLHEQLVSTLV